MGMRMEFPSEERNINRKGHGRGEKKTRANVTRESLRGQSKFLQILGDFAVPALLRKSQRIPAVVSAGMRVRSVGDKYFDHVETTVGSSLQQWRMTFAVTVVHVRAIFRQPLRDGGVSARDRSCQRSICRSVCRDGIDVCALAAQILRD